MTLEELVMSGKIDINSANLYRWCTMSEVSINSFRYLENMVMMELPEKMNGVAFAHLDGRRSIIRDLKILMNDIENLLGDKNVNH